MAWRAHGQSVEHPRRRAAGRRGGCARARTACQADRRCSIDEIVFTSGATESNNLALHAALAGRPDATLIITAVEHPAVMEFAQTRARTAPLVVVGVDRRGHLDTGRLSAALRSAPGAVVSVMAASTRLGSSTISRTSGPSPARTGLFCTPTRRN